MKSRLFPALLVLVFSSLLFAQSNVPEEYSKKFYSIIKRTEWWRESRFGMFIHFGPYSVIGKGEWVKTNEKMTTEQYQKYVDVFKPAKYNPKYWAKIAREAGMKYVVMTAKHHDGFCLFDSKYTDYKISSYMPGRDFIKEYLEAFRAEGIKVGLYYSIIDWHHKDYPNVGNHPMAGNKEWDARKYDWENYLKYMHAQVEELMTNYGRIDILWCDYSFDDYSGEKWKATELINMVRKHQPEIIINNRLASHEGVGKVEREFTGYGDFETPEQGVPDEPIKDKYKNLIPWETCLTLNNSWGFRKNDNNWKSPALVIHTLINCVSKGGNLLLNIGPDGDGKIPDESVKILKEVGRWMKKNNESIYGCGIAEIKKPEWGFFTRKENIIYAHQTYQVVGHINIKNYGDQIEKVTMLYNGLPAVTQKKWWGNNDEGNFFINIKEPTYHTFTLPDKYSTVFKLELKKEK